MDPLKSLRCLSLVVVVVGIEAVVACVCLLVLDQVFEVALFDGTNLRGLDFGLDGFLVFILDLEFSDFLVYVL